MTTFRESRQIPRTAAFNFLTPMTLIVLAIVLLSIVLYYYRAGHHQPVVHTARIMPRSPAPGEQAIIALDVDYPPANFTVGIHATRGTIFPDHAGEFTAWQYTAPESAGQEHIYIRFTNGAEIANRDLDFIVGDSLAWRLAESAEFAPSASAPIFRIEGSKGDKSRPVWRWESGPASTPRDFDFRQTGKGKDLTGYSVVTFRARGIAGGERVRFRAGGTGRGDVRGRDALQATLDVDLTTQFRQFTISLAGRDLRNVGSAFGWTLLSPTGRTTVIYVDNPEYTK